MSSSFSLKTPVVATDVAWLRLLLPFLPLLSWLLLVLLLLLLQWESGIQSVRRLRCFLFFSSPILPFLPLRPFLSRAFPARLSWLLATLVDGLAPSANVGRCPIRTHQAFRHHVMCLFDTSFSSCVEFSFLASTHFSCVVTSFTSSCPSWASTSLSSSRSS